MSKVDRLRTFIAFDEAARSLLHAYLYSDYGCKVTDRKAMSNSNGMNENPSKRL